MVTQLFLIADSIYCGDTDVLENQQFNLHKSNGCE
jgi:hypothetical protein